MSPQSHVVEVAGEDIVMKIAATGLVMGCVHVLTGPDHLSALATLSANVGNGKAFALGIQWGIGHSTGLLSVALILVLTTDGGGKLDLPPFVARVLESFVGVFMLSLGCITLGTAIQKRRIRKKSTSWVKDNDFCPDHMSQETSVSSSPSTSMVGTHNPNDGTLWAEPNVDIENLQSYQHQIRISHIHTLPPDEVSLLLAQTIHEEKNKGMMHNLVSCLFIPHTHVEKMPCDSVDLMTHTHDDEAEALIECLATFMRKLFPCCCRDLTLKLDTSTISGKVVAFAAGIIHGLAGPGGILGVIPAMHMHDWKLACLYLGCFCFVSTSAMGVFAALYGNISKALSTAGNAEFYMECFSSSLSIFVGVLWLLLLSIGKLDQVFD